MICIPLKCEELSSLKKIRASTFKKADLVEIWVDSMPTVKPEKIMRRFRKPLIIVNKGKEEHGSFCGTEKERIEILARYAAAGVAYVDLNVNTPQHYLREIFAKKNKRTVKSASEVYADMAKTLDPKRYGEYDVYPDDSHSR